jgi:hypothetical protein
MTGQHLSYVLTCYNNQSSNYVRKLQERVSEVRIVDVSLPMRCMKLIVPWNVKILSLVEIDRHL